MRRNGQDPEGVIRQREAWQRELQAAAANGDTVAVADGAHRLAILGGDEKDIAEARQAAVSARVTRFHQENPNATRDQARVAEQKAQEAVDMEATKTQEIVDGLTTDQRTRDATVANAMERHEQLRNYNTVTQEARTAEQMNNAKNAAWSGSLEGTFAGTENISMADIGSFAAPSTPTTAMAAKGTTQLSEVDETEPESKLKVAEADPADGLSPDATPNTPKASPTKTV